MVRGETKTRSGWDSVWRDGLIHVVLGELGTELIHLLDSSIFVKHVVGTRMLVRPAQIMTAAAVANLTMSPVGFCLAGSVLTLVRGRLARGWLGHTHAAV